MRLLTRYNVSTTPLSADSDYAAAAPRRLTFHNQRSPRAKTSNVTYVGTASLMTGASGVAECELLVNWRFRREGSYARSTVAPAW